MLRKWKDHQGKSWKVDDGDGQQSVKRKEPIHRKFRDGRCDQSDQDPMHIDVHQLQCGQEDGFEAFSSCSTPKPKLRFGD